MYRTLWRIAAVFLVLAVAACGQEVAERSSSPHAGLAFDGVDAKTETGRIEHGKRLSDLLGCTGCHQDDFSGGPFNGGRIAPNVSLKITEYDDAALDRAIRRGIAFDGRKTRLMPSEMYQWLSDEDFLALTAYLRSLEPVGVVQATFEPLPEDIATWEADGYTDAHALALSWSEAPGPLQLGSEYARGRYLAMNLCSECHNNQLQGYQGFTPDLTIVQAYSDNELKRLLNEGKGNVRDELGLMSLVSPARFPHLTDTEYDDLAAYLRARASALVEEPPGR